MLLYTSIRRYPQLLFLDIQSRKYWVMAVPDLALLYYECLTGYEVTTIYS